jgi:hypothetical protein
MGGFKLYWWIFLIAQVLMYTSLLLQFYVNSYTEPSGGSIIRDKLYMHVDLLIYITVLYIISWTCSLIFIKKYFIHKEIVDNISYKSIFFYIFISLLITLINFMYPLIYIIVIPISFVIFISVMVYSGTKIFSYKS